MLKRVLLKTTTTYEHEILNPGDYKNIDSKVAKRWAKFGIAEIVNNSFFEKLEIKPVSIVILVKDALDYFKRCLESVIKYTVNYELIIIDNGSNSLTKKYLSGQQAKHGFTLITNKKNKGFVYGCDQGIKVSTCDYICFLNSDCIVTKNWLLKLMAGFSLPNCGIVGPSSCWVSGKQMISRLSRDRFKMTDEEIQRVPDTLPSGYEEADLIGFCYVVSKKVIDRIGVFDYKRYGMGLSEEIDFNWRARKAGFKLYWVKDAYVHHYGSRTFEGMGLNPYDYLDKNRAILAERIKNDNNLFIENDTVIENIITSNKKTDVIIPVLDRPEETTKTLKALFANNSNINVIIIDNGSDDLGYLNKFDVKIIKNKSNAGTPKALNQGLNISKSEYVVLMHNDIEVNTKDWIKKAANFLDNNSKAGMVGIAGWKAIRENGSYSREDIITAIDKYDAKPYSFSEVVMCDGSCVVARKCGIGYDNIYGPMHFYDFDFSMQYRKAGYKLYVMNGNAVHFAEDRKKSTIENDKYKDLIGKRDIELWKENQVKFIDKWKSVLPIRLEPIPILMITWNRLKYTKQAIEALRENTYYPYILWIWDNGSDDGTVKYLKSLDNVQVYFSKTNQGLIPPMNEFFETFKDCEYVSKVDNDTVVSKGWLTKLKEVMDRFPLFVVQADHYLGLPYKLKDNQEFYNQLEKIRFESNNLYLFPHVSGTGVLIRRKHIDSPIEKMEGTLSGWVNYQFHKCKNNNLRCAFYDGVWVDRLDFIDTNKVNNDYPDYHKQINKMRSGKENDNGFGYMELPVKLLIDIKRSMKVKW